VPAQRFDFCATVLLRGIRWVSGRPVRPLAVQLPALRPADPQRWRTAFDAPVQFGAPDCRLTIASEDLALPIPTADPRWPSCAAQIASQAAARQDGAVSLRVRQALLRLLAKGDPRRETVAAQLCMSERTLQRRLTEEGTSFAGLVDAVRREAAQRLFPPRRLQPDRDQLRARLRRPEQLLPRLQALVRALAAHDARGRCDGHGSGLDGV
jgi:AraC-like DNA-binding protein